MYQIVRMLRNIFAGILSRAPGALRSLVKSWTPQVGGLQEPTKLYHLNMGPPKVGAYKPGFSKNIKDEMIVIG
jgi:hypothetical protein